MLYALITEGQVGPENGAFAEWHTPWGGIKVPGGIFPFSSTNDPSRGTDNSCLHAEKVGGEGRRCIDTMHSSRSLKTADPRFPARPGRLFYDDACAWAAWVARVKEDAEPNIHTTKNRTPHVGVRLARKACKKTPSN